MSHETKTSLNNRLMTVQYVAKYEKSIQSMRFRSLMVQALTLNHNNLGGKV